MDPKLLILDIDSTLVFSTKGYSQEYDFILGEKEYYVKLRPGL
jgi:TFIIF-interacting CTD phosphatase-like protein